MSSKVAFSFSLFLLFFFLSAGEVSAQVVINEIFPNPSGDDTGAEWLELYNKGFSTVDLSGYKLKDAANHEQTVTGSLDAGAWLQIYSQGSFSLNNSGSETISLHDTTSTDPLDTFSYNNSIEGKSWGRIPDGGAISTEALTPTGGSANQVPTPSPTPTLTPSPEPTSQPTATPTKTPTSSPIPTKTKTSTPKPAVKAIATESPEPKEIKEAETLILGEEEETAASKEADQEKKFPLAAAGIIFMGLGLVSFAGYSVYKGKPRYNKPYEEEV